ncbi:MAG: phage baseplate assembly protein V [Undibacterium sp.]|nr:phage baseplate assembly protein V [Undibacterium sp.]
MNMNFNELQSQFALGVTIGTVSNANDDQGLGRIRVFFSLKGTQIQSDWVQIVSLYAGSNSGAFFLPQKGDSVLLAFANGDPSLPYVLGFLWNGTQKPPVPQAQQQNVRVIKTKLGKTIQFDDSENGNITIIDNKQNKIVIDTSTDTISIDSQKDLRITAKGSITITGANVVIQNTAQAVKMDISANGMQLSGAGSIKLNAAMIDIN